MDYTAPASDELEVSLFGPGVGECVVVHLGDGAWMVVDSCVAGSPRAPVALNYLRRLNVDLAKSVKLVVATHMDDDHMRGLSEVYAECVAATLVLSSALRTDEAKRAVQVQFAAGPSLERGTNGLEELTSLLSHRLRRASSGSHSEQRSAIADRLIWPTSPSTLQCGLAVAVHALSPSDAAVEEVRNALAARAYLPGSPPRVFKEPSRNQVSVVLHVALGNAAALLGADLETTGQVDTGWTAVVERTAKKSPAQIVKIPHHGSENAHHDGMWSALLDANPLACIAPYRRSGIPHPGHIKRIKSHTPHVYVTAPSDARPVIAPPRNAGRRLKWQRHIVTPARGAVGHVRARLSGQGQTPVSVALQEPAYRA